MQEYSITTVLTVLFVMTFCSCVHQSSSNLPVPDAGMNVTIIRYDEEFAGLNNAYLLEDIHKLRQRHTQFTDLFFREVVRLDTASQTFEEDVRDIIQDKGYQELFEQVQERFASFDEIHNDINQTIENYLQLFPNHSGHIPKVYTFISGFLYQCFVFNDKGGEGLGLGLDLFLGPDYDYRSINPRDPSFSAYLTRTYNPDYISKKIAEVLVEDKLLPPAKSDFLSIMLWEGKKIYIMDQILNFKADTILLQFTKDQLKWCKDNEAEMWDFFFRRDLFYETDFSRFSKLVAPSPNSPGMPSEAPGQTGSYMGWRIVSEYMRRHPNSSIQELIEISDAQDLLTLSKYKPAE